MEDLTRWVKKILYFPLTRMIIAIVMVVTVLVSESIAFQRLGNAFGWRDQPWFVICSRSVVIASVCLIYVVYVRLLEKRRAVELSARGAARDLAAGASLGGGLFAATVVCLWLGGWYRLEGIGGWPTAESLFAVGLIPAFFEEILIRGIFFRITEESLGTWIAVALSALVFGLLHLLNPGATLVATLCIALEAGVLLALAYIITRRLWMPIGLHFGWNFTQGGIFGLAVSGGSTEGFLRSSLTGPELFSGGAFGAEASLFAVLVCGSASICLLSRARRHDRIIRPFWARNEERVAIQRASEPELTGDAIASSDGSLADS